ncbi:protease modulator HflC [Alphaproteobacteria bacterium]|jgi:membrane protease subunit HflC|nr:protease modulator HflC [Alphaproteobacteria bacterium]MDB4234143.1 protease modulator HflC [Alphaproteobacteria bacterium]
MKTRNIVILAILAFAIMLTSGFFFVVDQTKQVIVLQFGEPKAVHQTPGLKFKLPFIQNVVYYDSRVLNLDPAQEEVILRDQKRVVVDTIVRYEIKDPLKFFQTTRTELALIDRLGRIINSSVRGVISQYYLIDLLSETRNQIMAEILENVKEDEGNFGIEIVDLRLKRTELTNEVQGNVFDRMRTEREREANLLRAEGQEISQKIKATADREKIEIVAEAEKQSNILRGTGEAARNQILNDAFAEDPEFFEFIRSMEAYADTFEDGSTTMVISPDSDFFEFFENSNGTQQ